ncbi:hypothetical protein D9M68_748010 [compost metagenome]
MAEPSFITMPPAESTRSRAVPPSLLMTCTPGAKVTPAPRPVRPLASVTSVPRPSVSPTLPALTEPPVKAGNLLSYTGTLPASTMPRSDCFAFTVQLPLAPPCAPPPASTRTACTRTESASLEIAPPLPAPAPRAVISP